MVLRHFGSAHGWVWNRWTACIAVLAFALTFACSQRSDVGSLAALSIDNTTVFMVKGPQGGPFPEGSRNFALRNAQSSNVPWGVVASEPWLQFSATSGTLPPNGIGHVTVTIDQAFAATLSVGDYPADIVFSDLSNGERDIYISFVLRVQTVGQNLTLTPPEGFQVTGQQVGPFTPASKTYTLTNVGTSPVAWAGTSSNPWVAISGSSNGTLAPSAHADVVVQIVDAAANSLAAGNHTAIVHFTDTTDGSLGGDVNVTLDVTHATTDGWTQFHASPDTRTIYVSSSSGSDANSGLTQAAPKATIAAGKALMRNGYPDWLLLEAGDVWNEGLGQWKSFGRSQTEPQLISSYGTSTVRPLLNTGESDALSTYGGGGSPAYIDNVAFVGLHCRANTYDGNGIPCGFAFLQPCHNLLIEDCMIEGYCTNLILQGMQDPSKHLQNVAVRRSLIVDAFSIPGNPQGIYCASVDGLLLEENVFDHNGWSETIPAAVANIFRHNVYIDNGCTGVTVHGNIISNASSHGIQLRCGGSMTDNLFLRNSISMSIGGGNSPEPGGVTMDVRRNVILDGKDIDAANPRGWGIVLSNVGSGTVANNVVANQTLAHMQIPFYITGDQWGGGVFNTALTENIVSNWGGSVELRGNASQLTNISLIGNDFRNTISPEVLLEHYDPASTSVVNSAQNRFFSQMAPPSAWMMSGGTNLSLTGWKTLVEDTTSSTLGGNYPDPNRSAASYNATLGGAASHNAFMTEARRQSKSFWRTQYMAQAVNEYIRAGFGMTLN